MSKISRGISELGKHENTVWYTHTCSCGCGEHLLLEVTSSEDVEMVAIDIYATVTSFNLNCKSNVLLQFFSDMWWRIKTTWKVLIRGEINLQTDICINSKQGVTDYIEALIEASKVFKD